MTDRATWENFAELTLDEFESELVDVTQSMRQLLRNKRSAYGPHNLTEFGSVGVLIRTNDKLKRLIHMWQQGMTTTAVGEDALDAWADICGYALLVLVAERARLAPHDAESFDAKLAGQTEPVS